MSQVQVSFSGQAFNYEKDDQHWALQLKRSDVATQNMDQLLLLNLHHPMFLEQEMTVDDDSVTFSYALDPNGLTQSAIKARTTSEQLRLAINLLDLEACLKLPVTFFLHPDNLFITKDQRFKIAYRALPEVMTPKSIDAADFLKQVKCYILTIFTDYHFSDLYDGTLDVVEVPDFLKDLRSLTSLDELKANLTALYEEKLAEEAATLAIVRKSRHKLYKYASIWLSAAVVILMIPLIYLVFIRNPFKEKMLDADTAFIKVDYSGVINELKNVKLNNIPYTQKYELAYSYIKSLDFSDDKEEVIMNNVTLKTEDLYLDYWIEIGRSHHDEALDIAKRLDDSDLILYALAKKMGQVRDDNNLSGSEREEQLSKLQSEYDKYWEDRNEALTDDSGNDASTGISNSSSSSD